MTDAVRRTLYVVMVRFEKGHFFHVKRNNGYCLLLIRYLFCYFCLYDG